ncbi:MAG TPA: helix-turn-helix domain-containing protein [Verrucomicrobiae bacterium]|nr:helix-turn-helix domain-containing protein [Verrucomicrobiae bacterium]
MSIEIVPPPTQIDGGRETREAARIAVDPLLVQRPRDWRCWGVRDVAQFYSLSPKTIYRNPARFGGVRIGGRWRFSLEGIEAAAVPAKGRRQRGSA